MHSKKKSADKLVADLGKNSDSSISDDVFMDIIGKSTEKVTGFVRFSENFIDKLSYAFDMAKNYTGITVYSHIDENGKRVLEIDLSVVLEFGVNVYDICYNIKSNIVSSIKKKYSDTDITCINIYVSAMENNKKQGRK